MTKLEYEKFREHILEFYENPKELRDEITHYQVVIPEAGGSLYNAVDTMCQYGCFEVYYHDVLEVLKNVYGDDYDDSKYVTKDGNLRYKNNEVYCWTIYKAKLAKTIEMMYKKGDL